MNELTVYETMQDGMVVCSICGCTIEQGDAGMLVRTQELTGPVCYHCIMNRSSIRWNGEGVE